MNISSWKRIYKFVFLLIELLYYTSLSMILLKILYLLMKFRLLSDQFEEKKHEFITA